jgi:hypothetical protein
MPLGFSFAYYRLNELLDISEYVQKKTDKLESKMTIKSNRHYHKWAKLFLMVSFSQEKITWIFSY